MFLVNNLSLPDHIFTYDSTLPWRGGGGYLGGGLIFSIYPRGGGVIRGGLFGGA